MPGRSEPPIREFSDRSTLWLLELPENLRELLQLVARDIVDRLDFARAERIWRGLCRAMKRCSCPCGSRRPKR
jgi:hypothetical protein